MIAALQKRDSVVVLPTGGGKSLCFQAPAIVMPGTALIVSPLISLMKDQVDSLKEHGIAAAKIDSTQSEDRNRQVARDLKEGNLKIIYLSPERLVGLKFIEFIKNIDISFFAIDEAHCISMWGHDFRPEYRQMRCLRELFPDIPIHAFTATATSQVRDDISRQLNLANPGVYVGSFDRPNLIFTAEPRNKGIRQVKRIIDKHPGDSGIIYCIKRDDVDAMSAKLVEMGYKALPYHAGLDKTVRKNNQQAFVEEKTDIIVATVAFGMGIDKSNVRYVIHAGMPKSLEHYQQESGRAGRDSLEAECSLFYSGSDFQIWKFLMKDMQKDAREIALSKLSDMYDYCTGTICRHKAISSYFGQALNGKSCGACDICLGSLESVSDSLVIAQKIISCVARLDNSFGADYVSKVLVGSKDKRVLLNNHDNVSTYGILSDHPKGAVRDWIEQLCSTGYLVKTGEYNVVARTPESRAVLKGEETPKLYITKTKSYDKTDMVQKQWEGVDQGLFEELRQIRRVIADSKGLPAFIVFGDAVLRELARFRPVTIRQFSGIKGIGKAKTAEYGHHICRKIREYCERNDIKMGIEPFGEYDDDFKLGKTRMQRSAVDARKKAFRYFKQGFAVDRVALKIERAESTTVQYLVEFIEKNNVDDPFPWVSRDESEQITAAALKSDEEKLKPIYEKLGGKISYDKIRIALACLKNKS